MQKILDDLGVKYTIGIDEAAFYGPKLDIQYKNVFGKEDTLVTIQIDMLLAQRFGMEYTDADGEKKNPYIIHRTSLGCYERTLALLIEKYAGALPAGSRRSRCASCPSPTEASTIQRRFRPSLPRRAFASSSTRATKRSAERYATARLRRSPTCSS
jgi:threonyl-tRNA synthetase